MPRHEDLSSPLPAHSGPSWLQVALALKLPATCPLSPPALTCPLLSVALWSSGRFLGDLSGRVILCPYTEVHVGPFSAIFPEVRAALFKKTCQTVSYSGCAMCRLLLGPPPLPQHLLWRF